MYKLYSLLLILACAVAIACGGAQTTETTSDDAETADEYADEEASSEPEPEAHGHEAAGVVAGREGVDGADVPRVLRRAEAEPQVQPAARCGQRVAAGLPGRLLGRHLAAALARKSALVHFLGSRGGSARPASL